MAKPRFGRLLGHRHPPYGLIRTRIHSSESESALHHLSSLSAVHGAPSHSCNLRSPTTPSLGPNLNRGSQPSRSRPWPTRYSAITRESSKKVHMVIPIRRYGVLIRSVLVSVPSKPIDDAPIFRQVYPPSEATKRCYDTLYREPSGANWKLILSRDPDIGQGVNKSRWTLTARSHCTAMALSDYPFPGPARRAEWVERGLTRAARLINPHGIEDTNTLRGRVRSAAPRECALSCTNLRPGDLGWPGHRQGLLARHLCIKDRREEVLL